MPDAVAEVVRFYRVYHSMRYVRKDLVLRLLSPLSDEKLAGLNAEFGDIVAKGSIRQTAALPAEAGEPALAELPRLVLRFDRSSHGRLRQLIDRVNGE